MRTDRPDIAAPSSLDRHRVWERVDTVGTALALFTDRSGLIASGTRSAPA
jgi:hypothetical protein